MLPSYYEFHNPVKIVSGKKALENIPYELEQLGVQRPIVVTDKGVVEAGLLKIVLGAFDGSGLTMGAVFDDTPPDSDVAICNKIAALYRENECDCIIAVGGGSPIDTAKGAGIVLAENAEDLMLYMGAERLTKPIPPLIVVPSTSGTGSEVTYAAVIADREKGIKMAFTSYLMLPRVAVLDPRMTLTLPAKITAATGMDALTHAYEAYYCLQKNPVSDAHAMGAIKLISENLLTAVKDPKNEQARMAMANGALLAGAAFSNSMCGMVHSLGHAAGGVCHVPHGLAMSIFLPFGMEYNIDKAGDTIGELLLPLGGADEYAKTPAAQRPYRAVELVRKLRQDLYDACGLPQTLKDAGVPKDKLDEIANAAINDGAHAFNPEEMDLGDATRMLQAAYE